MTNERVLVTGAGGFIDSHLVEQLLQSGYQVRALIHYNSRDDWGHLQHFVREPHPRLEIVAGDVSDSACVERSVSGCRVVFHLAALIGIPYSYVAPESYVSTNITGTLNVLQACRKARTDRVIVTSTSEVYGTAQSTPMTEDHPLQGQSPYSATKIAADKLAEAYFRSFDLPVVTLRPFNTYGPRQSARAVIPTILAQALSGMPEIRLGSLEPRRDLTFVRDTAAAFVLAAEAPGIEGEVIHLGCGSAVSIGDLATRCLKAAHSDARILSSAERGRPAKSEVGELLSDPTKAEARLNWRPKVGLDEGLQLTVDYIREHLAEYRTGSYVI